MRRSLSALLLGASLVLASMSWTGFTITRTVLDPERSEVLADQLFESPAVRSALVAILADRMEALLPEGIALPRQELETAASRALDDPAVQLLVREGLVEVHQKALRGDDSDTVLHATAVGTAARNSMVAGRPELDSVMPSSPALRVALPTAGLSFFGGIRNGISQASLIAGILGALGAVIALLVARNRPFILRRVAFWAFGTAFFWLGLSVGIPYAVGVVAPTSGVLAAAMAKVLFSALIPGAVGLAAFGVALLGGSFLWRQSTRRRGSRMVGQPVFAR